MLPSWGHSFGRHIYIRQIYSNIIIYCSFDLICIYCISWFCAWRFDRNWSRNQLWCWIVVPLHCLHLMRTQYKQCCTPLALYFPRQPDTLLSHDYQYSRLNQLLCQKDPRWVLNKVLELVETLMRKSPCMRKYCSSQFTLCNISIVQVPIHPATCFAAQVAFVLGTRVFIRSTKVEICHVLHPWGVMWRTAVQPLPPKNLRRFASRDLDGVFWFLGSTCYLQLQQFLLQLFDVCFFR